MNRGFEMGSCYSGTMNCCCYPSTKFRKNRLTSREVEMIKNNTKPVEMYKKMRETKTNKEK